MIIIRHKLYLLLFSLLMFRFAMAQTPAPIAQLPVSILPAAGDTTNPLVMYITGDGGWNKFSKALATALANRGYPVVALDARDYFWKKKTAQQTAADLGLLIKTYQKLWQRKKVMLIGYSFGADVLPFAFNHLPAELSASVINISLLSPSALTDFEIHLAVMFGASTGSGESVVAAINKINNKPLTLIFGKGEKDFPFGQLTIKNYVHLVLEGGHHYDGDEEKVCASILKQLPKN